MPRFKYIGDGSFLPGIPARNLSEEEVEAAGLEILQASPLYEEIEESKSKPKKEDVNERSNKAQEDSAGS
jgi:hypothetical protein